MPLPRSQHASGGDGASPLPTSHNVRVFRPLLVCTGLWLVIFPQEQPAPAARWRSSRLLDSKGDSSRVVWRFGTDL